MNFSNLADEELQNSEAWLAEQIFSQLKDFNTEPLKNNEEVKQDYEQPNEIEPPTTISTDVLDLGLQRQPEQNFRAVDQEQLAYSQPENSQKHDPVLTSPKQNQNLCPYFEPLCFNPQIVECANCNCIFDANSFHQHICDYDEDNKLIVPEPPELSLAPFQAEQVDPPCLRLLRENQIRIRRFLKDELKYDLNATSAAGNSASKKQGGPHECTLCERKFVHASGLSRHMEKHALDLIPSSTTVTSNTGYSPMNVLKVVIKCTLCGRVFFQPETAYKHFCMHFTGNSEEEFVETADFPYENYLDDAIEFLKKESSKADNKPAVYLKMVILSCVLQCEFCDLLFSDVYYLFEHSASHRLDRPFECSSCEIQVCTSKEIFMHWQTECVFSRENLKCGFTSQRYYVCNVCENKFGSLESLHEHRYSAYHFFPRIDRSGHLLLLPCEYCSRVFESASEIVEHYEEKHYKRSKRDTTTKYRQYLCDICGKTYTQSSHLWQHLRFHKGVKPFACKEPGCSRKFTIRPDLNDHIRKCHTGERPYHCLICGRRFLTGSVFYQHRLIHRGERRYGCDECGKRFYRADALKNHLRIHTGEKPYGCLFCTKNFRQRGDRDKHIRARHSSLDANARLMMQMRKMQLEAAAKADPNSTTPAEEVLLLGNLAFPRSFFQPMLNDIDA